jgi:hypothetical protein
MCALKSRGMSVVCTWGLRGIFFLVLFVLFSHGSLLHTDLITDLFQSLAKMGFKLLCKTVRIETYTSRFGGKVLTDEKSHDFFNVPKLHPTHRWKRLLPISVPVPS